MPPVLKMATPQKRSWCVLQLAKKKPVTTVQRAFRTQFRMEPPSRVSIYTWYKLEMDRSYRSQWRRVVQMTAEIARLNSVRFLLVGYIKDKVFVSPLPRYLPQLRQRITTATASITRDTLHKVLDELDYSLNICRVTRRAHVESVRCVQSFESFSNDWCRCEVLSTKHLFSISFWKWIVVLCSLCI
jgi:hypothetical protein